MRAGLDTGFFVRLLQQNSTAIEVWGQITRRERSSVISCISLYELDKQGLKGLVPKSAADTLVAELPQLCDVVWLDNPALLRRAARLGHGTGLAMADALILASLLEAGAEEVYTTDSDFAAYTAGPRIITL